MLLLLGCNFLNASIWDNNTIPGPNDIVGLFGDSTASRLLINITSDIQIAGIEMGHVTLAYNSTTSIKYVRLISESVLMGYGSGHLDVVDWAETYAASIMLNDYSMFSVAMFTQQNGSSFQLDNTSIITVNDHGSVWLYPSIPWKY